MTGEERRTQILQMLKDQTSPLSGTALADAFHVSRQVIVQDIALMRAEKIQDKARKAGFDWAEMGPALDKAEEEMGELRQAVEQGANVEEELGDLLFAAVKVGRFAGLDSEQALHGTCEKFIRRFRRVEELAGGRPLDSLGLHRLEELWQQAKQDEA